MAAKDVGKAMAAMAPVEKAGGNLMRRFVALAIDGVSVLPGARETGAAALARRKDHEQAIDNLIHTHIALAGAQGFVTNLGGVAVAAVGIPANLAGLAILQLRLVAGIAHLRGYDIDDDRVRSAIMMTLLGPESADGLPTSPMLVATAPVFDAELDREISEKVMNEIVTTVGGRRAATLLGKKIPVIGGGVGAALDGWSAHWIGRYAATQFVDRRVRH